MATQSNRYSDAETSAIGRAMSFGGFGNTASGFQGGQVDSETGNLRPGSEVDVSKGTKPAEVIPTPAPEPPPQPVQPAPITPVVPVPQPAPQVVQQPAPQQPAPAPQPQLQSRSLYDGVGWTTYQGAMGQANNGSQIFIPQGMDPSRAFALNHRTQVQTRAQQEKNSGGLLRTMPGGREEGGPIERPEDRVRAGMPQGYPDYGGGMIGNGRYDEDSVIAQYRGGGHIALAGGEHVTKAPSVNEQTEPVLSYINEHGRLPPGMRGYAEGGRVEPLPAGNGPTPPAPGGMPAGAPPAPAGADPMGGGGAATNPLARFLGQRLDTMDPQLQMALASAPPEIMAAIAELVPEIAPILEQMAAAGGPRGAGGPVPGGMPPAAQPAPAGGAPMPAAGPMPPQGGRYPI